MCDVCLHYPCDPRCPNADPPREVYTCERCGGSIYEGEDYYSDVDGEDICEQCFDKWVKAHNRVAEA